MKAYKAFVLLPDGIGLRNFVFSDFISHATDYQLHLNYWNATEFDLKPYAVESIKLNGKTHFKTDLLKKARKEIEIKQFIDRFNNDIFKQYLFETKVSNLKAFVKYKWFKKLVNKYHKKLPKLRDEIKHQERQTLYYKNCINQLKQEQPDIVFCTNQRPVKAIAPILAAQDLGVPTATFIFSWDNLPKATMVIETDYYLVWSNFMAKQLCVYFPYIQESQIIVTGSPQFELHYNDKYKVSKTEFCITNNLPQDKKFLCFSGDDVTTSPYDPEYLSDVCDAVRVINSKGHNYCIIFRPCPVDFSDRYDNVLHKNKDIVFELRPKWKKLGDLWNTISPTPEDQNLLYNTIAHSDLIINLGSSMVFDAVCQNKPCAYVNYNPDVSPLQKDVNHIYKYIHFQSMPDKNAVIWLNSKNEITEQILEGIANPKPYVSLAKEWFKIINENPTQMASKRIVEALISIINK